MHNRIQKQRFAILDVVETVSNQAFFLSFSGIILFVFFIPRYFPKKKTKTHELTHFRQATTSQTEEQIVFVFSLPFIEVRFTEIAQQKETWTACGRAIEARGVRTRLISTTCPEQSSEDGIRERREKPIRSTCVRTHARGAPRAEERRARLDCARPLLRP